MGSIKDRVAIVGMGCTKFGENWDMSLRDMLIDAAYEAYEDAGIEPNDIEAVWFADYLSDLPGSGMVLGKALKVGYKPVTRLENMCCSGSEAIRGAAYAVASGAYDIALAIGGEKLKDNGFAGLPEGEMAVGSFGVENTYRARSHSGPGMFALMATSYFAKYGLSMDEGRRMLAQIDVKNHHNGTLHPKSHLKREITVEQALNAPVIAWPLGLYDCCGVSDGAAAAIIVRADMAKKFRPDPVYIKALQIACGSGEGDLDSNYDYAHVEENRRGAQAAYAEAGIKNPAEEISMAEVHDCFSIHEAVIYEDLGFCPVGKAKEYIEAGHFTLEGKLPVNTDGGLKCFGHPTAASGIRMLYEEYNQLQGKAGPRQLKNPKLGLVHNLGGVPSTGVCSIAIVGL